LNVGFYYMANAGGRLLGTVLSGLVFQLAGGGAGGMAACLWGSALLVGLSWGASVWLPRPRSSLA
ncbi:Permease of the major facilitator superfamily, partial [Candidatus Synechococcus spongiarum]